MASFSLVSPEVVASLDAERKHLLQDALRGQSFSALCTAHLNHFQEALTLLNPKSSNFRETYRDLQMAHQFWGQLRELHTQLQTADEA